MKIPAYILSTFFFLTTVGTAYAGSVNVNIKNNLNSDDSSQISSSTHTKVNISQEGEGTSSVTVNGKEWKLEGPGEINVDESSDGTSTPGPTSIPEEEESEDEPEENEPETPSDEEPSENSFSEIFIQRFEAIRQYFQELFSTIFGTD